MRNLLPAVGILLALLCAWLVFSQPAPDIINAGEGEAVQEDAEAELAPKIAADELSAIGANGAGSIAAHGDPDAQRESVGVAPDGMAEIGVMVMLAKSSEALMSVEVRAQRPGGLGSTFGDRPEPIESVRTGSGGEAVLRVPAGEALVISAGGPGKVNVRVSQDGQVASLEYEEATQEIEALRAGEKINIVLRLSEKSDLHWFQLVDGQSGAALHGARVEEPYTAKQEADQDGLLSVAKSNDFFGRQVVIFGMDGYGPRRVYLETGGDSPERALRVEVFPAARFRLTVLQSGQPHAGARIAMHYAKSDGEVEPPNRARAGGKPRMAPFWGDVDAQGVLVFESLPPHQPLVYGISSSFGVDIAQFAPGPLTLQPGEQREFTWEVGNQQDLHGRVIDADGSPVAGAEVWLLNSRFERRVGVEEANVAQSAQHYRLAVSGTDERGEFLFEQINPGDYWVALAPTDDVTQLATARRVTVPPLAEPPFVELQYSNGANVRGRCVTLSGEAVAELEVFAMETESRAVMQSRSSADGGFELGPFSAGAEVQFFIFANDSGYQLSEPVTALAGDGQEVILHLVQGGTIRGRTIHADTGEPMSLGVTLSSIEQGGASGTSSDLDGRFEWAGLAPGTWRVIAKNSSGWVGMSEPIILTAAELVENVEVRVAPGGTLVIESDGASSGSVLLSHEGWTVDIATVGPGERKSVSVPLGVIRIALLNGDPKPPSIGEVTVGASKAETFTLKANE